MQTNLLLQLTRKVRLGDNLLGVPNQMANDGISVDSEHSSHDILTGTEIAPFPGTAINTWDASAAAGEEGERAASLLRRVGSNGFNSSTWFDQIGGYFHSENMHVIERFHRDGNTLTCTATVDDPDVLLEPWTTTPRVALLNPKPDAMLPESLPCSERDLTHTVTKEHH
jgi:hypothetical protein